MIVEVDEERRASETLNCAISGVYNSLKVCEHQFMNEYNIMKEEYNIMKEENKYLKEENKNLKEQINRLQYENPGVLPMQIDSAGVGSNADDTDDTENYNGTVLNVAEQADVQNVECLSQFPDADLGEQIDSAGVGSNADETDDTENYNGTVLNVAEQADVLDVDFLSQFPDADLGEQIDSAGVGSNADETGDTENYNGTVLNVAEQADVLDVDFLSQFPDFDLPEIGNVAVENPQKRCRIGTEQGEGNWKKAKKENENEKLINDCRPIFKELLGKYKDRFLKEEAFELYQKLDIPDKIPFDNAGRFFGAFDWRNWRKLNIDCTYAWKAVHPPWRVGTHRVSTIMMMPVDRSVWVRP